VVLVFVLVFVLVLVLKCGLLLSWLSQPDVTVMGSHVLENEVEVL
jgi:hypothetical protein